MHGRKIMAMVGCLLLTAVVAAFSNSSNSYFYVTAAPSGAAVSTSAASFVDIPDLSMPFFQYQPGNVCITVAAECYTSGNDRMFVRALIDGNPASPSDVILLVGGFRGTHSFQFVADVQGGQHVATLQYKVDAGGQAFLGDRTMSVSTAPNYQKSVAAPSGPDVTTTSTSFQAIPHMNTLISLTNPGNLFITLSAEAEITTGKRMFVRALVDGLPTNPSDVIFCTSPFYGTRSFTFAAPNIAAGQHTVTVQWQVDGNATGYLGDRTLTVGYYTPGMLQEGGGTMTSVSAPSGPDVTTTSAGFVNIPDLAANVFIPDNSHLCIALTGEVNTSNAKRVFARAVIDGQPISPSNVVLNTTDFDGVWSFNFIARNVAGGSHQIALQWQVDGGGTAYMGDRNMTMIAFSAPCPDLTTPFDGFIPASGSRNVLAICWDPHRPDHPAPAIPDVEKLIFGTAASVRDYYIINSFNRVSIDNAGVKGWYDAAKPADYYWGPEDTNDSNGDGWIHPHVEKWTEAIKKADQSFDFAAYDFNGDKHLGTNELTVLMVIPQNGPFGTVRTPLAKEYPTAQPLIVDGIKIPLIVEVYGGSPLNLGAFAHELGHALFVLPDMYYTFFMPFAAGSYSLMDVCYIDSHLDPFLKIRLGWVQPAIVTGSGYIPIDAIEQSHVAYVLYDPIHGNQEYFIIENRQANLAYDSKLPDAGLAIWHIMEDPNVYQNLTTPPGVNPGDWASLATGDWGRHAIRMIRPIYGPPFDDRFALWDGADPTTGYDLLSTDPNPDHATLKWADGTPSGFSIKNISASGAHMTALIEYPGIPTTVEPAGAAPLTIPGHFGLAQNYPNPFNNSTTIAFALVEPAQVQVQIFNLAGQEVVTLSDRLEPAGEKTILWDGNNKQGEAAATGVYICQCKTTRWTQSKKLLLVR